MKTITGHKPIRYICRAITILLLAVFSFLAPLYAEGVCPALSRIIGAASSDFVP